LRAFVRPRRVFGYGALLLACTLTAPAEPQQALASGSGSPRQALPSLIAYTAYTHGANIYMMDDQGKHVVAVTTRAITTEKSAVSYPYYAWSPDGMYLLLVRQRWDPQKRWLANDLLLIDRQGSLVRVLASGMAGANFMPSWAADSDRIAYQSVQIIGAKIQCCFIPVHHTVLLVDTRGNVSPGWRYTTLEYGDGGPPGSVNGADWLFQRERYYQGLDQYLHADPPVVWSDARHLAIFNVGDLFTDYEIIDMRASTIIAPPDPGGWNWDAVALSSNGQTLAASTNGGNIALFDLRTGLAGRVIGRGLLPAWSRDGRTLFFEQRDRRSLSQCNGPGVGWRLIDGHTYTSTPWVIEPEYYTSLWQVDAVRWSKPTRILIEYAHGFGTAQPLSNGPVLVFSGVENGAKFCRQTAVDAGTRVRRYGPRVYIQIYAAGSGLRRLVWDAGRPAA
jgi:hypothetical protein